MNTMTIRWLRCGLAAILSLAGGALAGAQEQSAAEAARRAREAKQKQTERASKVWTNDNLPRTPGRVSTIGAAAAPSAAAPGQADAAAGQAPAAAGPASSEDEAERARLKQEIDQAKAQLDSAKTQLNLAQRDFDLFRQQFFSDPNYASNTAGQAQLNQLQAAVTARQNEVQQGEQQVAALEAQLKELEARIGPPVEKPKTPEEQQAEWSRRARALRDELAQVEAEIQRVRADAAARGMSLFEITQGGSPTADLLARHENRRRELQQQIAALEDEARRAGVPLSWVR